MTPPEPYRGLNAALARNSGPSAEDELAIDFEPLRQSLRWHFACHAEEPGKSYASLGIENAENIVTRMLAAAEARGAERGARAVVEALESLHRPDGGVGGPGAMCVYCTPDFGGPAEDPIPWPCATLDAAREAAAREGGA